MTTLLALGQPASDEKNPFSISQYTESHSLSAPQAQGSARAGLKQLIAYYLMQCPESATVEVTVA